MKGRPVRHHVTADLGVRWKWIALLRLLLFVFGLPTVSTAQMIIDDYNPDRHKRFSLDRSGETYVGSAEVTGSVDLDLSGVARNDDTRGRWVTMISPTHFLSVNHAQPGGSLSFHLDDDPNGPTIQCAIDFSQGRRIDETDLWLGVLEADAGCDTSLVKQYPLARPADYVGQTIYTIGRAERRVGASNTTAIRVGRNVMSYGITGEYFRGIGDLMVYIDDSTDGDVRNQPPQSVAGNLIDDESRVANGDSGGPSFVINEAGEMLLLGLHSYLGYEGVTDLDGDGEPDDKNGDGLSEFNAFRWASADSYLPTHRNEILRQVNLDDPTFQFELDIDVQPLGLPADNELFLIESSFDCSLDNEVDVADLNCSREPWSILPFDSLLEYLETLPGDLNVDSSVNFPDLLLFAQNFGASDRKFTEGDLNRDGNVEFDDFLLFAQNFGKVFVPEEETASVPEPSVAVLMGLAGFAVLGWFRTIGNQSPASRTSL